MKLLYSSTFLLSFVLLTACDKADTDKVVKEDKSTENSLTSTLEEAAVEARKDIVSSNMNIGDDSGKAKAEITPKGDLLIDGKAVTITSEQRQMLMDHRTLLVTIAVSGVEIGMQGADLASDAIGEAVKSVFTGDSNNVEKTVEAKAVKIEATAKILCDQLPLLMKSQEKLASSLPEFKPYATMTADEINDCHSNSVQKR